MNDALALLYRELADGLDAERVKRIHDALAAIVAGAEAAVEMFGDAPGGSIGGLLKVKVQMGTGYLRDVRDAIEDLTRRQNARRLTEERL